jgi:hypothetical protein
LITWTVVWVTLALLFNGGIWHFYGSEKALEFFTGYLIEKSLSVDNVFVFVLLFSYFAVPPLYQHKVLFWGILGALIMRAIMIVAGAAMIAKFAWIIYVFGAFLILTGIKMIVKREEEIHSERNPVVRWFKKLMPVTSDYRGDQFFVRENGVRTATPLFVVLLLVEFSDLIFAVTTDTFIVYTVPIRLIPKTTMGCGRLGSRHMEKRPCSEIGNQPDRHGLYVERVRHPRPALALLRAGGGDGQVSLPQDRAGRGADIRRGGNAAGAHGVENSHALVAERHRADPGRVGRGVVAATEEITEVCGAEGKLLKASHERHRDGNRHRPAAPRGERSLRLDGDRGGVGAQGTAASAG